MNNDKISRAKLKTLKLSSLKDWNNQTMGKLKFLLYYMLSLLTMVNELVIPITYFIVLVNSFII